MIIEFLDDSTALHQGTPVLRRTFRDGQTIVQAAFHCEAPQAADLYYQADLQCLPWGDHQCEVWLNHIQLRETLPFRLRSGSLLDFYITPDRTGSHTENDADAALDQDSLLQVSLAKATRSSSHTDVHDALHPSMKMRPHQEDGDSGSRPRYEVKLSEALPHTSVITCDLSEVEQVRQLLQQLPWLLMDVDALSLPSTALAAIASTLTPWTFEKPIRYQIFTDGSFYKNTPDIGGCGLALVILTEYGPRCGGILSRTCVPTAKSHSAENMAMIWAVMVAFQLSTLHASMFASTPFTVEFCYDATVTGQQSAGAWTAYKHPTMQRFIRDIVYVLQHRHGTQALQWTHVFAHQGHWWNEVMLTCWQNMPMKTRAWFRTRI